MIVARFASPDELVRAARRLRERGLRVETRTPIALPDDEPGRGSWIPLLMFIGGVTGAVGAFLMQTYATTVGYPLIVGGRPNFFWTSFTVFAFEAGILAAVATGFVSFLVANRLPRLWEPSDESELLRDASRDGWCLIAWGAEARDAVGAERPVRIEEVAG